MAHDGGILLYFCKLIKPHVSTHGALDPVKKMALKYYLYLYSCDFPSTNIFGYSFEDFWFTEYIQILVRKFFKIRIYLNMCSEPDLNVSQLIFNEKSIFRYSLCIKKYIQCKIVFRGSMTEPFFFNFFYQWWVQIFE